MKKVKKIVFGMFSCEKRIYQTGYLLVEVKCCTDKN